LTMFIRNCSVPEPTAKDVNPTNTIVGFRVGGGLSSSGKERHSIGAGNGRHL
jgi:hypothetical protein